MPRQSTFTDAEDRIILRHANQPAPVVNAALAAAGFEPRGPQQLSQRRYYLRRRRSVARVARSGSNAIIALETERHEILREIKTLDVQRVKLEKRLHEITEALVGQVAAIEAEAARVGRRTGAGDAPAGSAEAQ